MAHPILLVTIAFFLTTLGVFVWRSRPVSESNRWFAAFCVPTAIWSVGVACSSFVTTADVGLRLAFAGGALIPAAFLGFAHSYPHREDCFPRILIKLAAWIGITLAVLSLATSFVVYEVRLISTGVERKTGLLYLPFAFYCLATLVAAIALLFKKWRSATSTARVQLHYVLAGSLLSISGGVTTNLLLPLFTGRSTYSFVGPFFILPFGLLVAHAIIRHRLMDLRVVLHRGLTIIIATLVSLLPVAAFLVLFWQPISSQLEANKLLVLLASIIAATLLVPPTRDTAGRILDRYLYRTQTNFRQTVRAASRRFTQLLDLRPLLCFIKDTVATSIPSEGLAVYLMLDSRLTKVANELRHRAARFEAPGFGSEMLVADLSARRDLLLVEELLHDPSPESLRLHSELERLNWALVLPLLSEDIVIGVIAVGPKLSGDPFYPQDLDLLMTLAHQAGIAIKNAQLYTQVVLANEYIENIVGTIESGVVAVDAGGRVTMFNRAAEQLTGLRAEVVKQEPTARLPRELATLLQATVADGADRTEPEIALPDGVTTRPVICTTSPLRDPASAILGAVAVFSDLTPFKQLENERRRAERLAYFEILASSLAHEIKNPLVAIKTFSQLLPRRHRDEHFVTEFSRVVTREINRMERLVERLRALSRPSDGRRRPVDLREPLRQAVEFLRPAFDEKRIAMGLTLGNEPAVVLGDANELEQLFINLLMNAHEATPPEGTVSAEVIVSGGKVAAAVADSGPGIPADLLEHVFDPFITTKPRGSGLGLTISAGIAATHRAKLLATNRPGGGALFQVEFSLGIAAEEPQDVPRTGMSARHQ